MTEPELDTLDVWNENRFVGRLRRNHVGSIGFHYDSGWIEGGGFAVSRMLPLETDDFPPEGGVAHRFFANLLPEGGVRQQIVRDLKIPDTDFDLLRAIGGECAGALSVLPMGKAPSGERRYLPLAGTALERLLEGRGPIYSVYPPDERPRLSLAGAQDKCPVLFREGSFYLPQGEAPSTHILKFELADYRHVPAYETFTTVLARRCGLPVVRIQLLRIKKRSCVLIERYDRESDPQGEVRRLHQEDFCQALGYGHEKKYQDLGGPSFADCYALVRDASTDPAIDSRNLLRWQIFNVLAGNSDGHAKNLSLLRLADGVTRLAPFYDLVCTRAIDRIDYHLAFGVGGERNPSQITESHWNALAQECDVRPRFVTDLVEQMARALTGELAPARGDFESWFGSYPALQRVEKVVRRQCRRALRAR